MTENSKIDRLLQTTLGWAMPKPAKAADQSDGGFGLPKFSRADVKPEKVLAQADC